MPRALRQSFGNPIGARLTEGCRSMQETSSALSDFHSSGHDLSYILRITRKVGMSSNPVW